MCESVITKKANKKYCDMCLKLKRVTITPAESRCLYT